MFIFLLQKHCTKLRVNTLLNKLKLVGFLNSKRNQWGPKVLILDWRYTTNRVGSLIWHHAIGVDSALFTKLDTRFYEGLSVLYKLQRIPLKEELRNQHYWITSIKREPMKANIENRSNSGKRVVRLERETLTIIPSQGIVFGQWKKRDKKLSKKKNLYNLTDRAW